MNCSMPSYLESFCYLNTWFSYRFCANEDESISVLGWAMLFRALELPMLSSTSLQWYLNKSFIWLHRTTDGVWLCISPFWDRYLGSNFNFLYRSTESFVDITLVECWSLLRLTSISLSWWSATTNRTEIESYKDLGRRVTA